MNALLPVPFHGATLTLIDHDGEPFVAMRPIVEAMGMAWQGQTDKIKARYASVVMEIMTTGSDGKTYRMTCLPLRKLAGWLMTIHPNKVRPELRATILAYQAECDDALWSYWTQGQASRPTAAQVPATTAQPTDVTLRALVTLRNGVLVGIEPLPAAPCPRYHYPAETAKPNRRDHMINGFAWLHQIGSPLGDLLRQLKADGHDIDGALIQFHALRGLLTWSLSTWEDIRSKAWDGIAQALPFTADLPAKLWAMKDW